MANMLVDERDQRFVLFEMLKTAGLCEADLFAEHSEDMFEMVLETANKFAQADIWPTYQEGDKVGGAYMEDGNGMMPECFRAPFEKFCADGWLTVDVAPEFGGQGFPLVVSTAAMESFMAANPAFCFLTYTGIGAGRMVQTFGDERQKKLYMEPMYEGRWGGSMCLTEPGAGSDVGALTTTAYPMGDGKYKIKGTKIFITSGDQQFTENIVHPVLARIEGDVPGTKGISIFLVPKYRVNEDGSMGEFNDVVTGNVEHKMGIKASPTCTLNFGDDDNCIGELLGAERIGMKVMFQMMNEARIIVGMQGMAHTAASYQHAKNYAKERLQGSSMKDFKDPTAPRVPIIHHPDVRRMLMTMKSYGEGMRALLYYTACCEDKHKITEGEQGEEWHERMELLTPIVKAYCSDIGFRMCEMGVQVYGGYGYCQEYPMEQFLRDCKIASIYEGANGIQAMDLVGRKFGMKGGQVLLKFLNEVGEVADKEKDGPFAAEAAILSKGREVLGETAMHLIMTFQGGNMKMPLLNATGVLDLMGDVTLGWLLMWQAGIAQEKLEELAPGASGEALAKACEENAEVAFYAGKVASMKFFLNRVVSLVPGKAEIVKNTDETALDTPEAAF